MPKTKPEPAQASPRDREAKALATLKSDAPRKDKMDACKDLAHIGGSASVPVLAALLPDENLSHMARYGLEPNPDPSVDQALRDALGKVKGVLLAGVIGSLGVRHYAKAIEALARLLKDADPVVAEAAARALGKIGTSAAAKAIEGALAGAPEKSQLAFCEGLLRCAEALKKDEATAIYDKLKGMAKAPRQVRTAGLRGAILARGDAGVPLLTEGLRSGEIALIQAAVRAAMELPGAAATKALGGELGKLPADKQALLIQALGRRCDAAAVPALSAAAKAGEKAARVAAARALGEIGDASASPALQALAGDSDQDVAQAAKAALDAMPPKKN